VDKVHDLAVLTTGHRFPAVAPPLLAGDPHDLGYPVRITGVANKVPGVDSAIESLPVDGIWQGWLPYQDGTVWARVQCRNLMLGMSGAPVRRNEDDAIIGILSRRYNRCGRSISTRW
jgi:hypothetical protein